MRNEDSAGTGAPGRAERGADVFTYDDATVEQRVREHVCASVRRGGYVSLWFAGPMVVLLVAFLLLHPGHSMWLSLGYATYGLVHAYVAYRVGKAGRASGRVAVFILLPLVFMPVLFSLAAHVLAPGGVAGFLNGPPSFIYFILIIVTGFAFDARLSFIMGVGSGAGYFLMYLLARDVMGSLQCSEPSVAQMLSSPFVYAIKSLMMVVAGLLVATLCVTTRSLIRRVSHEEQEKGFLRTTFGMMVDPRVRDHILAGRIDLEGETRVATVLFCDVRGFTTFSQHMAPRQLVQFMKEYFDHLNREIRSQDGTILEYIGDEVMALFGAPLPVEDHAHKACQAACLMQQALDRQRPRWEQEGKPAVRSGVGIHTGAMLVGGIGSTEQCKYGVLGDNVNLASRLQGLTKDYGVRIIASEDTVRAAAGTFHVRELDLVTVRGRTAEVRIYEILGPSDEPLPPPVVDLVATYAQALGQYRGGNAARAHALFRQCLALAPDDGPSHHFTDRLLRGASLADAPPVS